MPKKKPEIIDHLDNFVDILLNQIADESENGHKALLVTMGNAKSLYNKPMESWFTGWIYKNTRTRGPDIERAMESIKAFPDAYTRLQDIKILVEEKGAWHAYSSYNYYLFSGLIKSVPGYKPLEESLEHHITLKVRDKIIDKIDNFMWQYKANQEVIATREKEFEAIRQSVQKAVDHVLIFDNLEEAQISAKKNASQTHFYLTSISNKWHLSWIDLTGKAYTLYPTDELISLLVDQKAQKDEQLNLIQIKQQKKECLTARDIFLDKVQLHINPRDPATRVVLNNESLIAGGVVATFILRGKPNQYSLCWISTLGKALEIPLVKYPQFKMWLDSQNSLGHEQLPQLKAHLLSVNTSKALTGIEDFKNELQDCLTMGPKKAVSKGSEKIAPKRLEMGLFAKIVKTVEEQYGKPPEKELTRTIEPELTSKKSNDTEEIPELVLSKVTGPQQGKCAPQLPLFKQKENQFPESKDEPKSVYQPS
ncbi:hypothetical protein TUM19329_12300 [Legionella antarctica]|uniref:Uncharacterized protein n=1 Tax=Legionella antarctica TaxID=2708020 RepID=A0A6F8T355_9GAMM|nr:hypothetical protein [Legionella antarctica]BCA94869.1 hypothetical protein TUM19329_12300 [Legionella antarctica]